MPRPGQEVIDVRLMADRLHAVEAAVVLKLPQRLSYRIGRYALRAEQKFFDARIVDHVAVHARDHPRPLPLDQRPQETSELDEVVARAAN